MWKGGMKLEQIKILEDTFAVFTEEGWIVPLWVYSLRDKIMAYQDFLKGRA